MEKRWNLAGLEEKEHVGKFRMKSSSLLMMYVQIYSRAHDTIYLVSVCSL